MWDKIKNSGTLAVMIFGIGPIALLLWIAGMEGTTVFSLWVVAGILIKFAMSEKQP